MAPLPQPVTTPPVPTRIQMVDRNTLVATVPWVQWFTNFVAKASFFQNVQADGVTLPQEQGLNFLSPLTATDNPGNGTTDIGFAGFDVTTGDDGTVIDFGNALIEFGASAAIGTGGPSVTVGVTFPKPFTEPPIVTCGPDNRPDNTGNFPFVCYPSNITTTGFMANFSCPVLIGGGGASGIHNTVHCHWNAMGV